MLKKKKEQEQEKEEQRGRFLADGTHAGGTVMERDLQRPARPADDGGGGGEAQHAGLVACQFGRDGAKGKFADVYLELVRGSVEFRDGGRHGQLLRTAGVIGCTVSVPKKPRKGQEHAFRVDLAADTVDSTGECKYIIGVDTAEEMQHWMNIFKAAASTAQDGSEQEASEVGVPPERGAETQDSGAQPEELTTEAKLAAMLKDMEARCGTMKKLMSRGLHDDVLATAQELLAPMSSDLPVSMYAQLHARCSLHLRLLEAYLVKAASKGHGQPVVDIYQRVQCCSGLLPRLYLLVTLGSVCIKMRAVKPKLILQDVAEMCHAVHHPVRGLFLRAFVTQMFRDKMPAAPDAISFLLKNFRETNKLWLRLHAETPEAAKKEQAAELHQMLEVVTVNLVRLRALRGLDEEMYRKAVLPFVQEQVVNARDPVLQETLYSAFVRVFADRHLATLPEAIQALDWLHPDTKAELILRVLMDVISESVIRSAQVVPANNDWFLMLTEQVEAVATRRSLGSDEKLLNSASLIRMSVACFPTEQKYVEQAIADGISGLEHDGNSTLKHSEQVVALISAAVSGRGAVEILGLESVTTLNDQLLPAAQAEVAAALCRGIISSDTPLDSPQVVEQVFRYLQPLIAAETDDDSAEGHTEKLLSESEIRGQQLLAALITQLRSDNPDVLFKLYVGTRKMFMRGGPARIKYTMPALVNGGAQLAASLTAHPGTQMHSQTSPKKVWGFCHQTCSELKKQGHQALALRLFLTCAQGAAAAPGLESVSSEFVSQALTILQEPTRAWSLSAAYAASPEAERTEALILCCGVVQKLTAADGDQSNGLKPEHAESAIATCTTVAREIGNHKSLISCAYLHAADEARQQTGMEMLEAALANEDGMDVVRMLDVLNALIYFAERGSAEALGKCGTLLPQMQSVEGSCNTSPEAAAYLKSTAEHMETCQAFTSLGDLSAKQAAAD